MQLLPSIFILISIATILLFHFGAGKDKWLLAILVLWFFLVGSISFSGVLLDTETLPPKFAMLMVPVVFLTILCFQKSKTKTLNINALLAVHALRIPVELVLFQLFILGKVPKIMTFQGLNFDLFIGISALIILLLQLVNRVKISPKIFRVWNIIGLCFLTIIVSIAVFSSPLHIQLFAFDQPNVAVLIFPYTYLPALVVPLVLLSHLLLLRKK